MKGGEAFSEAYSVVDGGLAMRYVLHEDPGRIVTGRRIADQFRDRERSCGTKRTDTVSFCGESVPFRIWAPLEEKIFV